MNTNNLIKKIKEKLQIILKSIILINTNINSEEINIMIDKLKNDNKFFVLDNLQKVNNNVEELNKIINGGYINNKRGGNNFFLKK